MNDSTHEIIIREETYEALVQLCKEEGKTIDQLLVERAKKLKDLLKNKVIVLKQELC